MSDVSSANSGACRPPAVLPSAAQLSELVGALGPVEVVIQAPSGDGQIVFTRAGYTSVAHPGPRVGRRTHAFEDFDSFAAWLNRHANPAGTEILVDVDGAVANLEPAHPHAELVTCPLYPHPRFARWAALLGKQLTQADFHRFIVSCPEDFASAKSPTGADVGSYGPFLAGQVGKLRIANDASYEVVLDDRGFATFTAANGKVTLQGEIPPRFQIKVPMFLGIRHEVGPTEETPGGLVEIFYALEIHLRVIPGKDEPPAFVLTCPQLEVVRREARLDAVAHLRRGLKPEFLVGLGKLVTSHRPA